MKEMSERAIECLVIKELQALGYTYCKERKMDPYGATPARTSHDQVLLESRLKAAIAKHNPTLPAEAQAEVLRQVTSLHHDDLLTYNQAFHQLLTQGIKVTYTQAGSRKSKVAWLVDFDNPTTNDFLAVNQYTLRQGTHLRRLDLVLFVNGLPLVAMELKRPLDLQDPLQKAYQQLQTYKQELPAFFAFNSLIVITDGISAKAGSLSAGYDRFMPWQRLAHPSTTPPTPLLTLLQGQLNPATLLDLIRHFTLFEKQAGTLQTIKKVAAYHQYYAASKALATTQAAMALPPGSQRRGGVVWHTQGSGKSLTMLFYAGKAVQALANPTLVIITDRNDLDAQLFNTFAKAPHLLRQEPQQATDRQHLQDLLQRKVGGIIFTTIQKFYPTEGAPYPALTQRGNVVVIADEAHRSQYGFKPKTTYDKDQAGKVHSLSTTYGFAKHLHDALPNATYLGFTGTPIEKRDANTRKVFGDYVDTYDIAQAVADGTTVPIHYESRHAKVSLTPEGKEAIVALDASLAQDPDVTTAHTTAQWATLATVVGAPDRLRHIAQDIVTHFEAREQGIAGKGMVVVMSRKIAAKLYDAIIKERPAWHSQELSQGSLKVVITAAAADGPTLARHHTTTLDRNKLAMRMKDPQDPLKLVIVCDMWLTGFDVPALHTLYIDKRMQGHNLMQAIARVNRTYQDKPNGLIVDYLGIASDLRKSLSFYTTSGGKGDPVIQQEEAVKLMQEKWEIVTQMLEEKPPSAHRSPSMVEEAYVSYQTRQAATLLGRYPNADAKTKLTLLLQGTEHILSIEDGAARFIKEVTALSRAFAMALPHPEAMALKASMAFVEAIKARLTTFQDSHYNSTNHRMETAIRQVIDKAITANGIVDIFDAAGIKKPDISILSEAFLQEIKKMRHTHVALHTLRKLLHDNIREQAPVNLVRSQSLLEQLQASMHKYTQQIFTTTQVIEELISLAQTVREEHKRSKKLNLTTHQLAFYDALASSQNAKGVLAHQQLRELTLYIVSKIQHHATPDWTRRKNARSRIKAHVNRALDKFGYPPQQRELAIATILQQAERSAPTFIALREGQQTH